MVVLLALAHSGVQGQVKPTVPDVHLETTPAQHIRATYTFAVNAPNIAAQEWLLFAAMPPTLSSQREVRATMNHDAHLDAEKSPFGRPLLTARVPAQEAGDRQNLSVQMTLEATLYKRKLVKGAPTEAVPPLDAEERRFSLAKTPTEDFTAQAFLDWLDRTGLRRKAGETDLNFAARVFQTLKHGANYLYSGPFQTRQASKICDSLKTDCGGLSVVFVSALRAGRVPARTLCGRWARTAPAGDPLVAMHVKSEFYAEGVGWVPCDLSSAVQFDHDGTTLRYFGDDPGDHLVQHTDTDLRFDTVYFGEQAQAFVQRVAYWVRGLGSLKGSIERETWQVETLPLSATDKPAESARPAAGGRAEKPLPTPAGKGG